MVEIEETPKIVIAKPIACRPSLSKHFTKFVSGAVNASPSAVCEACGVAVVRPRTLRLNPTSTIGSDVDCRSSESVPETKIGSNVLYKPVPKVVSKRTLSLLANLGSGRGIVLRPDIADAGTSCPQRNQDKPQTSLSTDFLHDILPEFKPENVALEKAKDNNKSLPLPHVGDRSSYDGHAWRKYGQKQVKGSEYPRSYYKCSHPHCPVKKKVEKSLDGKIAEIVYKGEHNHSKPPQVTLDDPRIMTMPHSASISTSNNSVSEFEEASESLEVEGDKLKSKRTKYDNPFSKGSAFGGTLSEPKMDSSAVGDQFRWRKYGQKVVKGHNYPRSYYKCTSPKCERQKIPTVSSQHTRVDTTTKPHLSKLHCLKHRVRLVRTNHEYCCKTKCTNLLNSCCRLQFQMHSNKRSCIFVPPHG